MRLNGCMLGMFIVLLFTGCQGYDSNGGIINPGGSSSGGTSSQNPTAVTTTAEGASATSLVLQSKGILTSSMKLFSSLGFMAQSQMVSATSGTGTVACTDYGTYDYTTSYNNGVYVVGLNFDLCREGGFQYDGSFTANGTASSLRGNLSGLNVLNFKNNYSTLIGSLVALTTNYTMTGSGDAANGNFVITANGSISAFDYYNLGQHTMIYNGLATSLTVTTDLMSNMRDEALIANGRYSVRRSTTTTAVTYVDFTVATATDLVSNTTDEDMSGRIIVDHTPNSCLEGVFDVTTATAIRTDSSSYPPRTTQGVVVTNTTATATYGASDTIDVVVSTDTPTTYAKEFMLMKQCDFYAMEQQLPIVSGVTGTAVGSNLSISALSTGPSASSLACFTDVHVSYYTTTSPTPSDSILWYVHWNSNLDSCVPQTAIPFQEATSSTGVATDPCDVGLDINGADQDITSGGVEHFLAAALPVGYYILSIDNYSCSTAVGNTATVLVGDYLFGPYNCTYTSADGDGSTPGAWCRLTDVRVNSDGSVDVIAPDASLVPWHP